jgi:hypothetical protein
MSTWMPMHARTAVSTCSSVELSAEIVNWLPTQVTLGTLGGTIAPTIASGEAGPAVAFFTEAAVSCALEAQAKSAAHSPDRSS